MGDSAGDRSPDKRPAWLPLAAAGLVVPTVLAGVTLLWPRPQIEDQLSQQATEVLSAAGFQGASLQLAGRDATLDGVPAADRQRAIDAVQGVPGVRAAGFAEGNAAPAAEAAPFGIARRGEDVVLTGVVGSDDERVALVEAAKAKAGGRTVVDQLTVTPGAPVPAGVDATSVGTAAATLAAAPADLAAAISPDALQITGVVADEAAKKAAEDALHAAVPGAVVDNQLTLDPSAAGTTPATELDAAARQQLQSGINQLLAAAPIAFGPNVPTLTPAGNGSVAKVLELVKATPAAKLQVDGYVAAGPGDGRLTAQQLSDQRASAVRDALVAGGVPADRITTRGLGEGSTPAQRAAGRRVEITVV